MRKKALLVVPVLYYAYIYFGLRWSNSQLVPLLRFPLGQVLLLSVTASFWYRAVVNKGLAFRLLFAAVGLFTLGLFLSLLTRQSETVLLREGEAKSLANAKMRLVAAKTASDPNFYLARDQRSQLNVNGRELEFGVLPLWTGFTFWHTVRFGFSPEIKVFNEQGRVSLRQYLPFGQTPIDERYNKLVPRRAPPRLMLGVGTYPPELETVFYDRVADEVYFLRIEKATLAGKRRDLMKPDYYLWLTDGRLRNPVYRLMVWRSETLIYNRPVFPGKKFKVETSQMEIGGLNYWSEMERVRDYGLPLARCALLLGAAGLVLIPVQSVARFVITSRP